MRIHFIAIGGAAMHSLAIALRQKGYQVTGSDDEIFEPARSGIITSPFLKGMNIFPPVSIRGQNSCYTSPG
jgi:hypothetical protein